MKLVRVTTTAAVFLFFGIMMPLHAQHDGQGDKGRPDRPQGGPPPQQQRAQQPQQQQQRAQQPQQQQRAQPQQQQQQRAQQQPQQQQPQRAQQPQRQPQQSRVPQQQQPQRAQQSQPQQQRAPQVQPQRNQQQARSWQQQRGWLQHGGGWQAHNTWQQGRAQRWSSDHRTWGQRGGYGGYYVPQASFNLSFGSQHFFRIRTRPVMYMGYPRFSYGGFSFLLVDPYPEYWPEDWYNSDDVYIDYDDGYYLYNRSYPDVRLAITVSL